MKKKNTMKDNYGPDTGPATLNVEIYTARLRRAATREMKVDSEKKSWKEETKK